MIVQSPSASWTFVTSLKMRHPVGMSRTPFLPTPARSAAFPSSILALSRTVVHVSENLRARNQVEHAEAHRIIAAQMAHFCRPPRVLSWIWKRLSASGSSSAWTSETRDTLTLQNHSAAATLHSPQSKLHPSNSSSDDFFFRQTDYCPSEGSLGHHICPQSVPMCHWVNLVRFTTLVVSPGRLAIRPSLAGLPISSPPRTDNVMSNFRSFCHCFLPIFSTLLAQSVRLPKLTS